ncbi:MAG: methyl-accepting chemotaxis protein [Gammaproteobacteria bacterium]|nr:methyl-accepting chemotaxis protein [Gammaproteobacteria bacterium]
MSLFSNLSIRFKVLAIVVGGIIGLAVTLAFNYNATSSNKVTLEQVRDIYFPTLERLDANLVRLEKIKETYSAAVIAGEEDMLDAIATLAKALALALNEVAALNSADQGRVDRALANFTAYIQAADALSRGMIDESLTPDSVQPMLETMNGRLAVAEEDLRDFREQSYQRFTSAIDNANEASAEALISGMIIGAVTALLLGVMGLFIGNSISRNITTVVNSLNEIANGDGDLTQRLKSASNDEIGALVEGFNAFIAKLQGVIIEVTGSTGRVAEAANEVRQVSEKSAHGMNCQQQEIQQVVNSMTEMTTTVEEIAGGAGRAADAANVARSEADAGKQVVDENMQAISSLAADVEHAAEVIQELDSHSDSIGAVLNVIRDIAEQTNLLALNAAIEAARAGEQGRGFAVVADEVRTLATRTHESTREINDMITRLQGGTQSAVQTMNQSREQAQASVGKASRVGESLERIAHGIEAITDMNAQIASAAEEQSAVTREINNNIVNLGQVVTQVAADASVAENGSEQLAALAQKLREQVSLFKV